MNLEDIKIILKKVENREITEEEISEVKESLKDIKRKKVKNNNQEKAKEIWILEQILKIQNLYIEAYKKMKEKDFYGAWCYLEKIEIALNSLKPHFTIDNIYKLKFIEEQTEKFQSIYPYKLFISPEIIKKKEICNICGKEISIRNPCGHEVGKIYNGELCIRIVKEAVALGVSFVESPVQKYSVPFLTDEETGEKIDHYDYSLLEYLIKRLNSPFSNWDVHWTKKRHPHSNFKDVGRNDECPCGSGKKYKKCCLDESGVLKPHCEFIFSEPIDEKLQNIEYNY
jgi:hypothetical protein